ncbi:40S ribosomal protein S5-1 [Hordeum vulgare]|nr:40S ribosomal protein S5-1 [Hordeum vulgare]
MKHPPAIEMHEVMLHIRDVQGPKKEGSEKARLAAVEQEIIKCQWMVKRGWSANHSMITDFIQENKLERIWERSSSGFKSGLNISKLKSMTSKTKTISPESDE